MDVPKPNSQNDNSLNQTESLIYWPILRKIPLDFLREVRLFKIFNNGQSAILIHKDGVYAFGDNSFKWLGVGDKNQIDPVEKIDDFNPDHIENIVVGTNFVLMLTIDGRLFGCGNNSDGQVPNDANKDRVDHFLLLKNHIKKVACGSRHVLALDLNGIVWTWGNIQHHQCQSSKQKITQPHCVERSYFRHNRIVEIACGYESSIVLDQRAGLYVWGYLSSVYYDLPILIKVSMEEKDCIKSIHGTYDACVVVSHFGKVLQCYRQNQRLYFQTIEPEAFGPIDLMITQWYNNELIMYSKEKSFFLWNPEKKTTIKVGFSATIPDVSNLYCDPNTPCLTKLPACLEKNEIQTSFNDPARCDLKIIINQAPLPRTIFMESSSIPESLKLFLHKLGSSFSNTEELILEKEYSYALLFHIFYIFSQNRNLDSSINYFGKSLSVHDSLEKLLKEKLSAEDLIELYSLLSLFLRHAQYCRNVGLILFAKIETNFRLRVKENNFIKLCSIISKFSLTETKLGNIASTPFVNLFSNNYYAHFCLKMKCFEESLRYDLRRMSIKMFKNLIAMHWVRFTWLYGEVQEKHRYLQTTILHDDGPLKQLATAFDPEQKDYEKFIDNHCIILVLHETYTMIKNSHNIGLLKFMVNYISENYWMEFYMLFYFYELSFKDDSRDETQSNSYLYNGICSSILSYEKISQTITGLVANYDCQATSNRLHLLNISYYIQSKLIKLDKEFQELSLAYNFDNIVEEQRTEELLAFIYFQFYDLAQRHKDFGLVFQLSKIICGKFIEHDLVHYLPMVYMLSLFYKDWRIRKRIQRIIMARLREENMFQIYDVLNKYEPEKEFLQDFCSEMSKRLNEFNIIIWFERTTDKQSRRKFYEHFAEHLPKHLSLTNCSVFYRYFINKDFPLFLDVQRFMIEKIDPNSMLEFYRLAIQNQDMKLLSDIRKVVQKNVDAKNICGMLQLASKESDHETFDLCFQAIKPNIINASNCFQLYKLSHCNDQDIRWKNLQPIIASYLVNNIKSTQILEVYCLAAKSQDDLLIKHFREQSQSLVESLNATNLQQMYQAALEANDEPLLKKIENSMKNWLSTNNWLKIYELAFKHHDYTVRQLVAQYWSKKREQIRLPSGMDSIMYQQLQNDADI